MALSPTLQAFVDQVRGQAFGDSNLITNLTLFKAAIAELGVQTGVTVNWQDEGGLVLASGTANFTGGGVTLTNVGGIATIDIPANVPFAGINYQEEGAGVVTALTLDFVGPAVTLSDVGGVATVTIPGIAYQEEGGAVVTGITVNFVGPRVTLTDVGGVATVTVPAELPLMEVTAQFATTVNGGTATGGVFNTRPLNTVKNNTITGASLAANRVTLPAGDYRITAWGVGVRCDTCQMRLRNITGTATLIVGMSAFSGSASNQSANLALDGTFTLGVSSALELQMFAFTTKSLDGLGTNSASGEVEVYSHILIEKLD